LKLFVQEMLPDAVAPRVSTTNRPAVLDTSQPAPLSMKPALEIPELPKFEKESIEVEQELPAEIGELVT